MDCLVELLADLYRHTAGHAWLNIAGQTLADAPVQQRYLLADRLAERVRLMDRQTYWTVDDLYFYSAAIRAQMQVHEQR